MTPAPSPPVLIATGTGTGVGRTIATAALAPADHTGGDAAW